MTTLVAKNLSKHYPTRSEPLRILHDLNLELSAGENVAIVGPSGSGKSTLLHILGTLDTPSSGTVLFDGDDPFAMDEQTLADFRNKNIGFIFQEHHLLPQLSVFENILVPTLASGKPTAADIERAEELIERVGLTDRSHHRPAELSGGERERVAVARALINKPMLLLADEPTGNLDHENARQIGELLLDIQRQEQMILVVVTHSQELSQKLDQQLELAAGQLTPLAE
ncbi:MAG: ABC transporter ATP-binding protein [Pirellulaceae bacterium]|jgi:lipoprotein-releasing system ATP-binding protein|nr:ABC transporter ATP-binding protein [Pirellulaceae bacterium]